MLAAEYKGRTVCIIGNAFFLNLCGQIFLILDFDIKSEMFAFIPE